ncbi:uncharacterized protein LOC144128151 isoform X2 [Amblyomma americanum]
MRAIDCGLSRARDANGKAYARTSNADIRSMDDISGRTNSSTFYDRVSKKQVAVSVASKNYFQ